MNHPKGQKGGQTPKHNKLELGKVKHTLLKFSDLVFMEDNPRRISEADFEALVESIRKDPDFFENRPCLVNHTDGKYLVYAGFQRAHAAHHRLGWAEIPCSIQADVPEAVMRERAIRDNTHQGTWNADVLSSWDFEVPELQAFGVPDFVFGGVEMEYDEEAGDYSGKNQELNTDDFSDLMELKMKFSKDDFLDIQERLNVVCAKQNVDTKEQALIELLSFYERHQ